MCYNRLLSCMFHEDLIQIIPLQNHLRNPVQLPISLMCSPRVQNTCQKVKPIECMKNYVKMLSCDMKISLLDFFLDFYLITLFKNVFQACVPEMCRQEVIYNMADKLIENKTRVLKKYVNSCLVASPKGTSVCLQLHY